MINEINDLFQALLDKYRQGIANTSTTKYSDIKSYVADELGLSDHDVYATGATKRVSNFDTRLAQGNQRNQHSPLALTFLNYFSDGLSREDAINRARDSFLSTTRKFVSGEERGTTFDGILCFIQLDDERSLEPLVFLYSQNCAYYNEVEASFPDLPQEVVELHRASLEHEIERLEEPNSGPWKVYAEQIEFGSSGSVVIFIRDPIGSARSFHPGDALIVVRDIEDRVHTALGRIHHYTCLDGNRVRLVLDKYAVIEEEVEALTNDEMTEQEHVGS